MIMMRLFKKSGKGRLCAAALLVLTFMAPPAVFAAGSPLSLTVRQVYTTSLTSASSVFTYRLKAVDAANPMPGGSGVQGYNFTLTGNTSTGIGPIIFTKQGIYRYQIGQIMTQEKAGYIYDKQVYNLEVRVDNALHTEVIVYNAAGMKVSDIVFENKYRIDPTNPDRMTSPPVKKSVTGDPAHPSDFTFTLKAKEAGQPMPPGAVSGTATLVINGTGSGTFGSWSYDKEGVYYYTVAEVNTGESHYTYDTSVYTITDTVKAENGQLMLTRAITNSANKRVSSLDFINVYKAGDNNGGGGGNGGPGGKGGGSPKTGDEFNTLTYIILFAAGSILMACAGVYLALSRKHKKTIRRIL